MIRKVQLADEYLNQAINIIEKTFHQVKEKNAPLAIIVSGGIDSSTLFALARRFFPRLQAFSLVSHQSHDLPYLKLLEQTFSQPITYVNIDDYSPDYLLQKLSFYRRQLPKVGIPTTLTHLSIAVGFHLLFEQISDQGIQTTLTAHGPDVLLGGYHRYNNLPDQELKEKIRQDLPSLQLDIKRDSFVAKRNKINLLNPYLSQEFINFCLDLPSFLIHTPASLKTTLGDGKKCLLRLLGLKLQLPKEIVNRPKEAFQYSTRLQKLLAQLTKERLAE